MSPVFCNEGARNREPAREAGGQPAGPSVNDSRAPRDLSPPCVPSTPRRRAAGTRELGTPHPPRAAQRKPSYLFTVRCRVADIKGREKDYIKRQELSRNASSRRRI